MPDDVRVHVVETGRLVANKTFLRGEGFRSLLRRVERYDFPALMYLVEHPEGLMAVDAGLGAHVPAPRRLRGFPPTPTTSPAQEAGPRIEKLGLDPADVRRVVLTHLDWDHTGGLRHFPQAEVLVHRPEYEFAGTRLGRSRYQVSTWPAGFAPAIYDLDDEPVGPFPASRRVTESGDVRVVPIPGHSPGQVAVLFDSGDRTLLFAADHMLRADWFLEDIAAGRLVMLGPFGKADARTTSRRLADFMRERTTVLLPAHDDEAATRLAAREPTRLS